MDVPRTVGFNADEGFPGLTDENATTGGVTSNDTVLSVDVDAALLLPYSSRTVVEAIDGINVPVAPIPEAEIDQVMLSELLSVHVTPVAVPF